jgi:hypothetical protein
MTMGVRVCVMNGRDQLSLVRLFGPRAPFVRARVGVTFGVNRRTVCGRE